MDGIRRHRTCVIEVTETEIERKTCSRDSD